MDFISYIIGLLAGRKQGKGVVVIEEGGSYTFTDDGEGNITMEEGE